MKQFIKASSIVLILCFGMMVADAQHIVRVKVKPARPAVVIRKTPSPGKGYIWVVEDWEPRGKAYGWKGGYWAAPPRAGAVYVPGHWVRTWRGWQWMPGRWKY